MSAGALASTADRSRRAKKRAVVTGGAGFVGHHLVDRLLSEGWLVHVLDDLSSGAESNVPANATLDVLDIASGEVDTIVRRSRPRLVYHLAAQASVPSSMADPLRDLAVNVIGTHRVAVAARAGGAERLVFVSSGGAIYGESGRAVTESASPAPSSFYGVHKLAAEGHISLSGLPFAIARPMNIYGPGQSSGLEGAVVSGFIAQACARQPITIDGDGRQTRDFVHVRDVVDALVRLGDPALESGIWNVAAGERTSILGLAKMVEAAANVRLGRVHRPSRPGDVRHSSASAARLRALGWVPSIALPDGIRDLIAAAGS